MKNAPHINGIMRAYTRILISNIFPACIADIIEEYSNPVTFYYMGTKYCSTHTQCWEIGKHVIILGHHYALSIYNSVLLEACRDGDIVTAQKMIDLGASAIGSLASACMGGHSKLIRLAIANGDDWCICGRTPGAHLDM